MIITEFFKTRKDGVNLYRTYSDANKYLIRNDGIEYEEAVDVEGASYSYTESERDLEFIEEQVE